MLSELNKEAFAFEIEQDREVATRLGPAGVVDRALASAVSQRALEIYQIHPDFVAFVKASTTNLEDNRKEAEQYVAGLLGMM